MSDRSDPAHRRPQGVLALLFLVLSGVLAGLTAVYWLAVLEPRLEADARASASALAQSQARNLAEALVEAGAHHSDDPLAEAMDEVLVLTDSSTGLPFVIGLAVKVDHEVLDAPQGRLDLEKGAACGHCLVTRIPLYQPRSRELMGIATFRMSNAFLQRLKEDVRTTLFLGAGALLLALVLAWRAVAALIRNLRLAQERAERATRAKSEFLANMSHEIRTPMSAVLGNIELLLQDETEPQRRDRLATLQTSARSLLRLLDDVLDLSKVEAGALTLEPEDFGLRALLEEIIALMGQAGRQKGVDLRLDLDPAVPERARGDPARLRQVLLNLVGNALKFTERGTVTLRVRPAGTPERAEREVEFAVIDTGPGFAGDPDRLFEKFSRADSATTRRYGGSGLGLAISKQLVEAMGGAIRAESVPGEGSTFRFRLPLQSAGPAPAASAPREEATAGPLTLLLADDTDLNRRVETALLERAGHEVLEAANGEEAVAIAAAARPDAVLMDLHMPDMDGVEAARRIRAFPDRARAGVPILALSADIMPEEQARCREAGMDGFVAKPLQLGELQAALAQALAARPGEADPQPPNTRETGR